MRPYVYGWTKYDEDSWPIKCTVSSWDTYKDSYGVLPSYMQHSHNRK